MFSVRAFRDLTFVFRRANWLGVSLASAIMNIGAAVTFVKLPTLGLLLFVAGQTVGYFAPLKRFILINLIASFVAVLTATALSTTSISASEFAVASIIMGGMAFLINALRTTEEQLDDARWRADIASEAADIGIFKWDFETDLVSSNHTLRSIFGLPQVGRIFADDVFALVHPDDIGDLRDAVDAAIAGNDAYHAEFRVHTNEGPAQFIWVEGRGDVVTDQRTGKRSLTGVNFDITDRKDHEAYIGRLLNGVAAALCLTDHTGRILQLNEFAATVFAPDLADPHGVCFWDLPAFAAHRDDLRALFNQTSADDRTLEITIDRGEKARTYLCSVSKIARASGVSNYIPYAVDITARKDAEMQNEILVAELNHRIKNLFSVVNALITLSARHATTVDDFARSTLSRLSALHAAHNLGAADLSQRGASLMQIIEKTLAPWRTDPPRIFIDGDDQFVDAGEATSWALITHELVTNANKYGALAHGGKLFISLEQDAPVDRAEGAGESMPQWRFTWRETGLTLDNPAANGSGFGQTVIQRLCKAYLNADVTFDFRTEGLQVVISRLLERD